ncbi:MAG TPA: response regulator transcription factor [Polyangiaceae bacterium]|nr:response regulator transcription factor [Polyangiaceae bacterium]
MRVLVADDHELVRSGMRAQLTTFDAGTVVLEAADWPQTLTAGADPTLDLALIDLRMPGRVGAEALGELLRACSALPVIVVSASDDTEDMRRALTAGAMGYLSKQEPGGVLLAAIRLVLSGGVYVPAALAGLTFKGQPPAQPEAPVLTERQLDVLHWVMAGKSNQEIADLLQVARGTVKVHLASVFRALDVTNRTQAAVVAERLGLCTSDHD